MYTKSTVSAKDLIKDAYDKAAAAALEARQAQQRAASEHSTVQACPVDLSDTATDVTPTAAVEDPQAAQKAAAAHAMVAATKAAFTKAVADGLSVEDARDVARKAGKRAHRSAMRADSSLVVSSPAATTPPVPVPVATAPARPAPVAMPPANEAADVNRSRGPFSRPIELSADEKAARATAMALEMAERAERTEKAVAREKANKKTVKRVNRL